jgi:hypothetical protein
MTIEAVDRSLADGGRSVATAETLATVT